LTSVRPSADNRTQPVIIAPSRAARRNASDSFYLFFLELHMSAKNETAKLFKDGLAVRRAVLGTDYVDGSIAKANDFTMAFQHITSEWCWGYAWTRDGLSRKTRSMLNLAMLTALNRSAEIKLHVKGALANGVTVEEIKEVLLHATVYCGIPAGLDAFKAANQVLEEEGAYTKAAAKAAKKSTTKKSAAKKPTAKKATAKKAVAKKPTTKKAVKK
jgi:4-carboxymuconolactone decarboxylase